MLWMRETRQECSYDAQAHTQTHTHGDGLKHCDGLPFGAKHWAFIDFLEPMLHDAREAAERSEFWNLDGPLSVGRANGCPWSRRPLMLSCFCLLAFFFIFIIKETLDRLPKSSMTSGCARGNSVSVVSLTRDWSLGKQTSHTVERYLSTLPKNLFNSCYDLHPKEKQTHAIKVPIPFPLSQNRQYRHFSQITRL